MKRSAIRAFIRLDDKLKRFSRRGLETGLWQPPQLEEKTEGLTKEPLPEWRQRLYGTIRWIALILALYGASSVSFWHPLFGS